MNEHSGTGGPWGRLSEQMWFMSDFTGWAGRQLLDVPLHERPARLANAPIDPMLETAFRDRVSGRWPHHVVLGEEFDLDERIEADGWVIDVLDGTAHWACGLPDFSIAIAHLENGRVVAVMVHFPFIGGGIRYWACDAVEGAWLDGTPIAVLRRPPDDHAPRFFAGDGVGRPAEPNPFTPLSTAVLTRDGELVSERARHPFPAHRRICSVAEGGLAGTVYSGEGGWDVTSVYLVQKAGGVAFDLDGEPQDFSRRPVRGAVAACDQHVAEAYLARWREATRGR